MSFGLFLVKNFGLINGVGYFYEYSKK